MGGKSSKGKSSRGEGYAESISGSSHTRKTTVDQRNHTKRSDPSVTEKIIADSEEVNNQLPIEESQPDTKPITPTDSPQAHYTANTPLAPEATSTQETPHIPQNTRTPQSTHNPLNPPTPQHRHTPPVYYSPKAPYTPEKSRTSQKSPTPQSPRTPQSQHSPHTPRSIHTPISTPKLRPVLPPVIQEQENSLSTTSSVSSPFQFVPLAEEDAADTPEHSKTTETNNNLPLMEASTSMSGLLEEGGEDTSHSQLPGKAAMVDVKTSTPQMSPCFCPDTIFYHRNQHVGTETRHVEFKRGGVVFDQRAFRSLIGRYMCAFLNTEGGVIYFGVTDDGKVVGIKVDQKMEDEIRLSIDSVVSSITPNVPTAAYTVNLAKVMNEHAKLEHDLKVMEICVHPRNPPKSLHSFDGNKYVRRDGSLRTL